jgi:hypothetical protein
VLTVLPHEREAGLAREPVAESTVSSLSKNPDARFALGAETNLNLLSEYADSYQGIATADYPRFGRYIWECPGGSWDRWSRQQSTVGETELFGGREHAILWENGAGALRSYPQAAIRGTQALGLRGIAVTQTRNLPATLFSGTLFDNNTAVLIPKSENLLAALWVYVTSPQFVTEVRRIDQKLFVTNSTLTKVPFDVEHWRKVADEQYPHGLPEAHSDDPTQWLFKGGVVAARAPLHVAVARLLGHRWPDQTPDALDQHSAVDGIVCVPALPGQQSAQERLRALLVAGYSERWSASTIDELLAAVGSRDTSLENWLRDGFFEQHCKLFHHRPFVWQIWDGRRDGFSALVNYHRLDRPTLEKLAYTYIGSWLERQRDDKNSGVPGADDRLAAAQGLQRKLALILEGEDPYDIFVRWKKDHEQAVGWNPDLDDGVRLNIRPFIAAGVLRWKPNIKWDRDRGKNPDGSERVNDRHLTLAAKREARDRVGVLA